MLCQNIVSFEVGAGKSSLDFGCTNLASEWCVISWYQWVFERRGVELGAVAHEG